MHAHRHTHRQRGYGPGSRALRPAGTSPLLATCLALCAGEINTLQGNLNWVASREHELKHPIWHGREEALLPLCNAAQSDSANLDNVAELLVGVAGKREE